MQNRTSSDGQIPSQLVILINKCFECGKEHETPRNLRSHLSSHHNYDFPKHNPRRRHFNTDAYTFVKAATGHEAISKRCSCPCCSNHFEHLEEIKEHFVSSHPKHLPSKQQPQHQQEELQLQNNDIQVEVPEEQNHEDNTRSQKRLIDTLNEEALNLDGITFDSPHHDDHLVVGSFDVTDAFYMMQCSLSNHKWKLSLEDHIHLGLAASSILLLCREEHPNDLVPFVDNINLTATRKYIEDMYSIRNVSMPMDTVTPLLRIVDQLNTEKLTRIQAS
jgi:hypothetical protein